MAQHLSSGTFYVFPEGESKGFRMSCRKDPAEFVRTSGHVPVFNPDTAKYATSDMVTNIVANSAAGEHPIIVRGDQVSSARVLSSTHTWKQFLTLEEACAHKYLGASMPSREAIIARYAELQSATEAIEA